MRIVKTCESVGKSGPRDMPLKDIKPNTVFRYSDHTFGPYLRTYTGYVDLLSGQAFASSTGDLDKYIELPDAVLVTNEK